MPFYERGDVRIHYEEAGSGFPLFLIPGGGLHSTISFFNGNAPLNAIEEFKDEYRCITMDLRNANGGQSSGPLEIDRPWDAYADDQLGLMDHLGLSEFLVLGFCIGGPFIRNLLRRAPERVVAAVLAQPSGFRPEMPDLFYHFHAAARRAHPARRACTRAKDAPRQLTVRPQAQHEPIQAARQRQETAAFTAHYARRAGIEGARTRAIRRCDLRHCRDIGHAKTQLQHVLTARALNLVRVAAWLEDTPRAATRRSACATLAA